MPGATSRPPTTVMGQIMATFALPKDNDKDKDKDKHKDQDHQIPDKTSNTIRMLGTIAVMWLTGMSSPTSTPSAKEDKGCQQWTFTAGHILCCHCNYILDKRPDLPLQELQSLRREPAKAPCELAKLVKHVCLEQFIGQLINSSLRPVDNYLYLIVVPITLMTNS